MSERTFVGGKFLSSFNGYTCSMRISPGCHSCPTRLCWCQLFAIISGAQRLGHAMDKFTMMLCNLASFVLHVAKCSAALCMPKS